MLIVYTNDSNITVGILVEYYVQYYVIIITKNEFGEKGIPKKNTIQNKAWETSCSNVSFEAHCTSNDAYIIAQYNIITIKNKSYQKIMFKTQLLAKSNPVKLVSLTNFYGVLFI